MRRWALQKAKKSAADDNEEEAEEATEQDEDDEMPLLAMVSKILLAHLCMHYHLLIPIARTRHTAVLLAYVITDCSIAAESNML